ncbi:MAG: response regulator transcription factor [Actinobacteria bacterium]|nr:response regulator transcription factor [Actinomycetota bacterium]
MTSKKKPIMNPQVTTLSRLLVVENNFRLGMGLLLAKILQLAGDPSLQARVIDAKDLAQELSDFKPEVVVLDIDSLRHSAALQIALDILDQNPDQIIVLMSEGANPIMVKEGMLSALWSNAYWLNQPSRYPELVYPEILRAFNGKKQLSTEILEAAVLESKHLGLLSPQQHRVMRLVSLGASNAKIARDCRLTVKAVERTIAAASKSMDVEPSSPDTNHRVNAANMYGRLMHFADISGS